MEMSNSPHVLCPSILCQSLPGYVGSCEGGVMGTHMHETGALLTAHKQTTYSTRTQQYLSQMVHTRRPPRPQVASLCAAPPPPPPPGVPPTSAIAQFSRVPQPYQPQCTSRPQGCLPSPIFIDFNFNFALCHALPSLGVGRLRQSPLPLT